MTHVDSELPGGVVKAEVVAPVDRANGDEAVPAGAILQGAYDSGTVAGESRLLVVFTRIIFPPSPEHPNGRAYAMGTQSGTDALGGAGLSGSVNTHAGRVFGSAVLYTLLGAAGTALGNIGNHGTTDRPRRNLGDGAIRAERAGRPPDDLCERRRPGERRAGSRSPDGAVTVSAALAPALLAGLSRRARRASTCGRRPRSPRSNRAARPTP